MRFPSRLLPGLLVAGLASGGVAAERPREADLGKKRSAAPDASLAGTLESKAKRPEEKGPALDFETFRYHIEVQVSSRRREEIEDLQKLIRLGGTPAEMPGWLFRLGELYWEEARYDFFEANRRDDELIRLGQSASAADVARIRAAKKELEERSRAHQARAIDQYKEILRRFPKYQRLDEVLFFLGENLWKQGKQEEALTAYRVLVTRYPKSKYVPDAWMAFGEYYFNSAERARRNENLNKALGSYQRAASYTESSVYGYAMYKQAWVFYNLGKWREALDLFRAVVFFGDLPTSTIATEKKLALVKEARKDYVRTYSHIGSPEGAMDEFRRVGGEGGWWDMLKGLAGLYFDEGQDREAILVFHQLIKQKPLSPEAPLFQARIVTAGGRLGKKDFAVRQAHEFVRMLKEIEDSKTVRDEAGKKLLADARQNAENTLRTLAVQYHNEYRKTRDEPVAALAADVYQDYLTVFPGAPQAYEMRFFHAELLFGLEKYQPAGEEYGRVVDVDVARLQRKEKPGKYLKDALENAVFSFDLVAKKFEETEKRTASDAKQRLAIPKPKQQLLDACLRYLKHAPKGEKYVEMAYKGANIYYRYNWFAEATDLFTRIALDHPKHELAGYATNLVLDAYNLLGDWRNVNGWAKRFWRNAELVKTHPQLKDDLARIIEQSSFKVIEEYERSRNYGEAAEAYLAFVRDWPGSKLAPTALYNASVDYANARRFERAVEVRGQLVSRYADDPLVAKCVWSNGSDYEAIADFEKAADYYERYFEEWRKGRGPAAPASAKQKRGRHAKKPEPVHAGARNFEEQKARDALYNAGVFREGLRQWSRAESDRLAYVATWPEATESPKVFLSVADLYGKQKAHAKELRQLEDYQKRYARDGDDWLAVQQRIARILEGSGGGAAARRAYEQALHYYRSHRSQAGERGMAVVAQAMYLELEPEFDRYDRIRFDVKPKHLKAQLDVKKKRLREVQEKYAAVVKLKQAESAVCSLYRIGLASSRFAEALLGAPVPKELKALRRQDVIDEYRSQLQQVAAPFEQDAIQGMELAVKGARDYAVMNDCSRNAFALLSKHKPEQHGATLEILPPVTVAASAPARDGHGLLSALLPPPQPPRTAQAASPALPPLRDASSAAPPSDPDMTPDDEPRRGTRAPAPEPLPPPPGGKDEDEDLLR